MSQNDIFILNNRRMVIMQFYNDCFFTIILILELLLYHTRIVREIQVCDN